MKALHSALALLFVALLPAARAADFASVTDAPVVRPAVELEELVAPIALYPDPLVALILPAATRPAEIVLAARFLDRGGNAESATRETWDDSVKSLTRYREVLEFMDRQLEWTRSLGQAFLDQPDDVMDAIQTVRLRARSNGLLADSREQAVIVDDGEIRIVPASPTLIYIPRYDPRVLYVTYSGPYPSFWLTFGIGYGIGTWLNYDCDWRYRSVRIVQRPPHWYAAPDWRHRRGHDAATWVRWTPPPRVDHRRDGPHDGNRYAGPRTPDVFDRHHGRPTPPRDGVADNRPPRHRRPETTPDTLPSTAPEVVTSAPATNAPAVVTTPPGRFNQRPRHQPASPADASGPVVPRYEAPRPPSHSPVPRYEAPRPAPATPTPRYDAPRPDHRTPTPRYEPPRPTAPLPTPAPAPARSRSEERHPNAKEREEK